MILSRAWYVALAVALGAVIGLLFLATAVSNRTAQGSADKLLTASSRSVHWYLTDDARQRAAALIEVVVSPAVQEGLSAANKVADLKDLKGGARDKVRKALREFRQKYAATNSGIQFDALWAIDIHGRVVANENFERGTGSEHYEMGGFSLVADAIHGWIRDDAWVFDHQIHRVVARPVETEVNSIPVGAVVASKVIDDGFAQAISDRTGAAVAFYANKTRIASGAPPAFDKSALEVHAADIEQVALDPDYREKGRTLPRILRQNAGFDVSVVFSRMRGEAWDLGAGYIVGHRQATVVDPMEFRRLANADDKKKVPLLFIILAAAGAALIGLIFTLFEHSAPLRGFRRAIGDLSDTDSSTDVLKPATFRGPFKKIAAQINDALDKVASAAGIERGPANLESVLGPLPAQPQMSAFAVPDAKRRDSREEIKAAELKSDKLAQRAAEIEEQYGKQPLDENDDATMVFDPNRSAAAAGAAAAVEATTEASSSSLPPESTSIATGPPEPPAPPRKTPSPQSSGPPPASTQSDEESQSRKIFSEFVALKKELGESTDRLTYEKFRGTLQRNKDALTTRHNCRRVRFRVYEKGGKAALKASPIKE